MAAPVKKDQELELTDRLARVRRQRRRAPERVRRLRPPRPAGRHGARPGDEREAEPRGGAGGRGRRAGAASGSRRRARTTPPAAAAVSRISPTRRRSRRRRGRCARRCAGSAACRSRRSSRSSRPSRSSTTATSWSTRSRRRRPGPALGFHKAGRWDEVLDIERCWLTTDLGNALRLAVRDWARSEQLPAYDQAEHTGYLRHLVVREGRNTGQALVQLVTAPGEPEVRARVVRRDAAPLPGGALDPLVGQ